MLHLLLELFDNRLFPLGLSCFSALYDYLYICLLTETLYVYLHINITPDMAALRRLFSSSGLLAG